MSLARFSQGDRNLHAGDFGEAWVRAVAAGCGHIHASAGSVDAIKADLAVTYRGEIDGWLNPRVLVQVKTTVALGDHDAEHWSYGLDIASYDALRHPMQTTPIVLAVIGLSDHDETVRSLDDGTLLLGRTAWVSLEGCSSSDNAASQSVLLPKENRIDEEGLYRMLSVYGVPRSSRVPSVSEWGEES